MLPPLQSLFSARVTVLVGRTSSKSWMIWLSFTMCNNISRIDFIIRKTFERVKKGMDKLPSPKQDRPVKNTCERAALTIWLMDE